MRIDDRHASAPAGVPRQPSNTLFIPYAQLVGDRRTFNQRSTSLPILGELRRDGGDSDAAGPLLAVIGGGVCVGSDEAEVIRMLQGHSWP
jgi:hypothetical protein